MMIKTVNLQKVFRTEEVQTLALSNVNIEVNEGEFVAVMGPSGCGKSTLLNILGLLDNPTAGEYYLNGTEVSKYTESQRTSLRKGVIGFVFQSFNLIDELNVYENIELPLLYMGVPASERKRRIEQAMERMAISHRAKHFPQQLSGGQQQRVAIARAVVANPKLILADEPTGNLDSKNGKEVMDLLKELNKEGTTIVMVTHSQHDAGFADVEGHWAASGISYAANKGWIRGYDATGLYEPDGDITRAETIAIVNRMTQRLPHDVDDLVDGRIAWADNQDATQWYWIYIEEAANSHTHTYVEGGHGVHEAEPGEEIGTHEQWGDLKPNVDWDAHA